LVFYPDVASYLPSGKWELAAESEAGGFVPNDERDDIPTWGAGSLGASTPWPNSCAGEPTPSASAVSEDDVSSWRYESLDDPGGVSTSTSLTAPAGFLVACAVVGVVALVIATQASMRPAVAALAWMLGGFGCMGLLVGFTVADVRRQADPAYVHRDYVRYLRWGLLALAAAATALSKPGLAGHPGAGKTGLAGR
jgi:hypothetical protein